MHHALTVSNLLVMSLGTLWLIKQPGVGAVRYMKIFTLAMCS